MMRRGLRLAIVITHQPRDDCAVAPLEPRNIAIQRQIFPVLVMPAVPDHVPGVMQQGPGFQKYARLRGKMMHCLQLVEKKNAQLPNVFRMLRIVSKPPRKTSRSHDELPRCGVVAVRLLARKSVPRDILQHPLTYANAGYRKCAQIQISPEGDERDRRNRHHVSAVAPYGVSLHARTNV